MLILLLKMFCLTVAGMFGMSIGIKLCFKQGTIPGIQMAIVSGLIVLFCVLQGWLV